ncbi:hypothetical protein DJ535_10580 [Citrobacter murliniae]|uniref:Uncharacterized protein n=1 Tax=Citrobacter murliniae TaxID=67829 RepID=A0ABY2PXR5_9ENTR|nr:hypothetical protein DJ535_10580 [Citrobacter murliniae]
MDCIFAERYRKKNVNQSTPRTALPHYLIFWGYFIDSAVVKLRNYFCLLSVRLSQCRFLKNLWYW